MRIAAPGGFGLGTPGGRLGVAFVITEVQRRIVNRHLLVPVIPVEKRHFKCCGSLRVTGEELEVVRGLQAEFVPEILQRDPRRGKFRRVGVVNRPERPLPGVGVVAAVAAADAEPAPEILFDEEGGKPELLPFLRHLHPRLDTARKHQRRVVVDVADPRRKIPRHRGKIETQTAQREVQGSRAELPFVADVGSEGTTVAVLREHPDSAV